MNTVMKRITVLAMIVALAVTLMPMVDMSYAAVKKTARKPAKVKITRITTKISSVSFSWSKAKNAKKYQVYIKKGKKWKRIKVVKKPKYTYIAKKDGTYIFKVRGVNGKNKGKWSRIVKAKLFDPSGDTEVEDLGVPSITVELNGSNVTFERGKTYDIPLPGNATRKVVVTGIYDNTYGNGETTIEGTTTDGNNFFTTIYSDGGQIFRIGDVANVKPTDTVYFTLDKTEPQVPQADKFYDGPREYLPEDTYGPNTLANYSWDLRYAGTITYDRIYDYSRGCIDRTTPYFNDYVKWYKVYRNGKLIYEAYEPDNNPDL